MVVFIVDPSAALRSRVREVVEEGADVEVAEAAQLSQGLDELIGVDALLIEIGGADGLALLRRICARHPNLSVVVLTNHASEHHRRAYLACGAEHVFDKSREFEQAARAVRARSV